MEFDYDAMTTFMDKELLNTFKIPKCNTKSHLPWLLLIAMPLLTEVGEHEIGHECTDVKRHRSVERKLRIYDPRGVGGDEDRTRVEIAVDQRLRPLTKPASTKSQPKKVNPNMSTQKVNLFDPYPNPNDTLPSLPSHPPPPNSHLALSSAMASLQSSVEKRRSKQITTSVQAAGLGNLKMQTTVGFQS